MTGALQSLNIPCMEIRGACNWRVLNVLYSKILKHCGSRPQNLDGTRPGGGQADADGAAVVARSGEGDDQARAPGAWEGETAPETGTCREGCEPRAVETLGQAKATPHTTVSGGRRSRGEAPTEASNHGQT